MSEVEEQLLLDLDQTKKDRSKAKMQVTSSARRLSNAILKQESLAVVRTLMIDLSEKYSHFCEVNEQYEYLVLDEEDYRVVNGEDIPTYRNNVKLCYDEVIAMYMKYSQSVESKPLSGGIQPISQASLVESASGGIQPISQANLVQSVLGGIQPISQASLVESLSGVTQPTSQASLVQSVSGGIQPISQASLVESVSGGTQPMSQSSLVQSVPGGIEPVSQASLAQSVLGGTTSAVFTPVSGSAEIRLKRLSLPVFTGERRDWPEFKAVWKQLAENAFSNKTALAHELKRSVKGEALKRIKSVYVTRPEAYDTMWTKLETHYDDTSATVQTALDELHKLKPVTEENYRGFVELVDAVEASYSQLDELNQLNTLTMRDVDRVNDLLPSHLKVEWNRKYHELDKAEKLNPFEPFMKFLDKERQAVTRLAEGQSRRKKVSDSIKGKISVHHGHGESNKRYTCAVHRKDQVKHTTSECDEFKKLTIDKRYEALKQAKVCFICFGNHFKQKCPKYANPCTCGFKGHHPLLCKSEGHKEGTPHHIHVDSTSYVAESTGLALYPIQQAKVCGTAKTVTVFSDGGSNTTYITHRAADRIRAKKINNFTLDVTTMGNVEKTYDTCQYQFELATDKGKKVTITAFGMDRITGPVSKLDTNVLSELFPGYEPETLQRKTTHVDILLGCDYFGLHPKLEEARCGDNLSIMRGEFGVCLQGTHPELKEETKYDSNLAKAIHESKIRTESHHVSLDAHAEFAPKQIERAGCMGMSEKQEASSETFGTFGSRSTENRIESFVQGEELGTEVNPRCGGCRCNKCPIVGHSYSFKEEQELKLIQENLEYDVEKKCWITSYPWLVDPASLPNNYNEAFATLRNTERSLRKDQQWSETYQKQIEDMVNRGVAEKLTEEELQEWNGPTYYISHLAVVNQRSQSTPVRIVFNSSQVCQGTSLNACLAKGPDCYMNNLVGILLRWREEQVALVGDIRKMFNSIHLKPLEKHCHRFLWRDLETDRDPDVYMMTRVNMGDTPAPAISTEAVYKTADLFENESPEAANLLKRCSYVDDLIDSKPSISAALNIAKDTENMLAKGGFKVKCWQLSGESHPRVGEELNTLQLNKLDSVPSGKTQTSTNMLKGTDENLRVLGLGWNPETDKVVFEVNLNFSKKKKGVHTEPHLVEADLPKALPTVLSRRIVLGQVMKLYDPLGLVSPFTLFGKIYLRETWLRKLDWDEELPSDLYAKWVSFFCTLFQLEKLKLDRCLCPPDSVGKPMLIILSDGSDLAYGFAAYIRWCLENGDYWCRLIMAKCRIAPINKLSTPQMELNAAVLSKRGRKVIEKEMRFEFERTLQIVDSETVLNMINKTSTRFKVYEGVRIGEIQAATNGDVTCWAWMSGEHNTADWLTRGRNPVELGEESHWWTGPPILYRPVEEWGLKFGLQMEGELPGEKKVRGSTMTTVGAAAGDKQTTAVSGSLIDYTKYSNIERVIWTVARLLNVARSRSFKGGKTEIISAQHLREAENFIVKDMQKSIETELTKKGGGKFAKLRPAQINTGLWVVGRRLTRFNPMTDDGTLQKLLPTNHPATRLFMKRAHQAGHRGRDATLARFRMYYWTPRGSKLASSVRKKCQLCKLRDAKFLEQEMGLLPESRLKPSPPFNYTMLDLFGPYTVRGEVQKRTSGKAYGVMFTDVTMRAVHIEAVFGYDTNSFLMALSRFASIRGWPQKIYSDPGSQLAGAERELKEAWQKLDREDLHRNAVQNGANWVFGPADSPWHQGAVESLIKSAKRAIHFAVHNQRLSVPEFQTVCSEVSNLLNERPIGAQPSTDSTISVLTPNNLLLGRATASNPLGWQPCGPRAINRYYLVQAIVEDFWKKWTELYAPSLLIQKKWNTASRNLCPGDVVMVADKNTFRGNYKLAIVKEVFPGQDGKVRRAKVQYKSYRTGERPHEYHGADDTIVSRAVQRLAVLVPVEE